MINREHWSIASRQIFFWHYFCFWVSIDLVQNLLIKIKKTVHGPGPWQGVHGPGPWKWSMDPVQRGGPWTPGPCFVLTPVALMNTSENLDSTWKSGANSPLSASLNTRKTILDFTVVNFQKEKQFYCTKVCYELLDYNTSITCVFVYFRRTYMYKTVNSVSSYSFKCSHFSWTKSL